MHKTAGLGVALSRPLLLQERAYPNGRLDRAFDLVFQETMTEAEQIPKETKNIAQRCFVISLLITAVGILLTTIFVSLYVRVRIPYNLLKHPSFALFAFMRNCMIGCT